MFFSVVYFSRGSESPRKSNRKRAPSWGTCYRNPSASHALGAGMVDGLRSPLAPRLPDGFVFFSDTREASKPGGLEKPGAGAGAGCFCPEHEAAGLQSCWTPQNTQRCRFQAVEAQVP